MWLLLDTGLSKLFYMIRSQNHIWYEMRIGQRILFLPLRTISLIGVKAANKTVTTQCVTFNNRVIKNALAVQKID